MQSFEKINPHSLLDNALISIRSKILSGELKIGDYLPPEREMAEQMGISRSSLHQAILELEYQGFVTIVPRRGTVVNDFRKYPTTQSLEALMSNDSLDLDISLFQDMMDFRLWLESECARKACEHIYPSTKCEMLDIIDELSEPGADIAELMYQFHYKLTQASGNSLYSMVWRGFEPVLKTMIEHHYSVKGDDLDESISLLKKLMDFIESNDPENASSCVCKIITIGINVLSERYNR